MPGIGIGISPVFGRGGQSWDEYWSTRTPSNFVALANSETEIICHWIDAVAASDGLKVYVDNVYNQTVAFGVETATITGLTTNTLYTIKLVAYKGTNESATLTDTETTLVTWYLTGGISAANVKGAYKAIGAANLAAAKVNQVNPGTNDLSGGVDPTHDPALGLIFNGTTQYLTTGLVPVNDQTWSMIIRWSEYTTGSDRIAGLYEGAQQDFGLAVSATGYSGQNGQSNGISVPIKNGITCISGPYLYLMGVLKQTIAAGSGNITYDIWIGATHYTPAANFFDGNEQVIAIFNTVLTAPKVLALTYRMEYLEAPYNISLINNYVAQGLGGLVCWNMATFDGHDTPTADQIDTFAPTGFDIDNWLDACVAAGMTYAILTTKHWDGFCLWPTASAAPTYDPYSIEYTAWYAANGSPDVVGLFVAGCRSRGLKVGLYFNLNDLTWESRTGTTHATATAAYLAMVEMQLSELLTNYGKIDSLWIDGWGWHVGYTDIPYLTIYNYVKAIQPYCVIVENSQTHPSRTSQVETYEVPIDGVIPADNVRKAEEIDTPRIDGQWFAFPASDQTATAFDTSITIKAAIAQANSRNGTYLLAVTPTTAGVLPTALKTILEEIGV